MDATQMTQNPFVICRAAAGSGKTFALVKEYLKLAMTVPGSTVRRDRAAFERELRRRFAGILAITFTNKAAGEMKSRVLEYLEQIAQYGTDASRSRMGAPLLEALNAMPPFIKQPVDENELRWMAEVVHSAILHQYSDLSVCTIDSFMHRIVRTFAHDLDRPVNFEVMIDQDEMIQQAVSQLMSLIGVSENDKLTRVMCAFAESRMEDAKGYNIEGELTRLARQLFKEGVDEYLGLIKDLDINYFVNLHKALTASNRLFEKEVCECGQAVTALLQRDGVEEADCAGGRNGYYGFFRGLAAGNIRPLTASVANAFETGKLHSAKCPVAKQDVIGDLMDELYPLYERARAMLGVADGRMPGEGDALRDYNTRTVVLKNLYSMALLNQLKSQLDSYSKKNEVVHLSEFNHLINSIVSNEPAPFIYERLGNRYHHFLIDEFQDTSVLQWHNLVPLLENGVSQRYESLVVGDGKQAIYRFRQGDVRQFVALPRVEGMPSFHGQTLAAEGNYSHVHLDTNYRTASSIVDFNNAFFSWLLKREPFASNTLAQQIYVGVPDDDGHAGLWQRLPVDGAPEGHVGVTFIDGGDADAVNEQIRQTIVRLVTQQGYRQRDIMVLGRSNKELDSVNTYLQGHGDELRIEVSSSESFFLVRSHAVMAVVSALRLLYDPNDRVAAADLLQRLYNLGLVADCHHEAFLTEGAVDVAQLLRDEHRGFDFRPEYLSAMDVYDCCEELVRELHLDGIDTAYVGSLLGRVAAFASRHHQGVAEFLAWFDDNATADLGDTMHRQLSAASPEGVDAVRLMTIHKAKGLESPVIICPFMPMTSHGYKLWVSLDKTGVGDKLPAAFVELSREGTSRFDGVRDEERRLDEVDQLNVLYVALTRPQEQLFIICPTPSKTSKDELSYPRLIKEFMDSEHPALGDAAFHHFERKTVGKGRDEVELHRLMFAEWTNKVQVASPAERALTPLQEESVRLGNVVHDVMAQVHHASDIDAAVQRMAVDSEMDAALQERLKTVVRGVVSHADTERFFREEYGVKTECDLCDDEGLCRPDRVVLTPDETWVVDFKTGRDLGEEHDRQVRRYCRAMKTMGYPQVSGWLIYLLPEVRVRQVEGV